MTDQGAPVHAVAHLLQAVGPENHRRTHISCSCMRICFRLLDLQTHTAIIQPSYVHHTAIIRQSYVHHTAIIRPSYGHHTVIVRPSSVTIRPSYVGQYTGYVGQCM